MKAEEIVKCIVTTPAASSSSLLFPLLANALRQLIHSIVPSLGKRLASADSYLSHYFLPETKSPKKKSSKKNHKCTYIRRHKNTCSTIIKGRKLSTGTKKSDRKIKNCEDGYERYSWVRTDPSVMRIRTNICSRSQYSHTHEKNTHTHRYTKTAFTTSKRIETSLSLPLFTNIYIYGCRVLTCS